MSAPASHAEESQRILDNVHELLEKANEGILHPAQVQGVNTSADRGVQMAQVHATLAVAGELKEIATLLRTSEALR